MFSFYKRLFAFALLTLSLHGIVNAMEAVTQTEEEYTPQTYGVYPKTNQPGQLPPYRVYAPAPQQPTGQLPQYMQTKPGGYGMNQPYTKDLIILPVAMAQNQLSVLLGHEKDEEYWTPIVDAQPRTTIEKASTMLQGETNGHYSVNLSAVKPITTSQGLLLVVPVNYMSPESLKKGSGATGADSDKDDFAWFPLDTIQTKMTIPSIPVPSQGGRLALIDPQLHAAIKSNISEIKNAASQSPLPTNDLTRTAYRMPATSNLTRTTYTTPATGQSLSPLLTGSGVTRLPQGSDRPEGEEEVEEARLVAPRGQNIQRFVPSATRGQSRFVPVGQQQQLPARSGGAPVEIQRNLFS